MTSSKQARASSHEIADTRHAHSRKFFSQLFRHRAWERRESEIRDAQSHRTWQLHDVARNEVTTALSRVSENWRLANAVPYNWLYAPSEVLYGGLTSAERWLIDILGWPPSPNHRMDRIGFYARQNSQTTSPFQSAAELRKRDNQLLQRLETHRNQAVWPTLTPVQRSAVQNYTRQHGPHSYARFTSGYISPLVHALRDLVLPEPVIAYRVELATKGPRRDYLLSRKPGDVLEWPQPLSARVNPEPLRSLGNGGDDLDDKIFKSGNLSWGNTVIFEMYATRGLYVGKKTLVPSRDEEELLIAASSKWLVRGHVDVYAEDHTCKPVRRHMIQVVQA